MVDTKEELESRLEQLKSKRDKLNMEISNIHSRLDKDRSRELQSWLNGRSDRLEWTCPHSGSALLRLNEFNKAGEVTVNVFTYTSDAGHQFRAGAVLALDVDGSTPGEALQQLSELLGTAVKKIKEKA